MKRRTRRLSFVLGLALTALALIGLGAQSVSAATTAADLNHGQVETVGTSFTQKCDKGPGWVFVLPASQGSAFVSLTAEFENAGTVSGAVLANDKFAIVNTVPLTDTLLNATAQVKGGHVGSFFNLTHVCEGTVSTTTTSRPNT